MITILWILFACNGSEPAPAPTSTHSASADLHGGHSHHMADMARTRTQLREALGPAYDQPVPGLDTANPEAGRAHYDALCATCHGATGRGDGPAAAGLQPPPADLTDAFHARYYSDAARVRIIEQGIPGTSMAGVASALSPTQILDLYAYILLFRSATSGSTAPHAH